MEIRNIKNFLGHYEKLRERTLRVVACIPSDIFDWTPIRGKFRFADSIRHLAASERYMFAENIQGNKGVYPGQGRALADGEANILLSFYQMPDESMQIFLPFNN